MKNVSKSVFSGPNQAAIFVYRKPGSAVGLPSRTDSLDFLDGLFFGGLVFTDSWFLYFFISFTQRGDPI